MKTSKVATSYGVGEPTDNLKDLAKNYEAFNILMGNFEHAGVFSDKLQSRVYSIAWRTLDVRIRQFEKTRTEKEAVKSYTALYEEFCDILNTYSIFSDKFKVDMMSLFLSIAY